MELEDHEAFNNNHTSHPKPYNSPNNKKYHGERSSLYKLNGIFELKTSDI